MAVPAFLTGESELWLVADPLQIEMS